MAGSTPLSLASWSSPCREEGEEEEEEVEEEEEEGEEEEENRQTSSDCLSVQQIGRLWKEQ